MKNKFFICFAVFLSLFSGNPSLLAKETCHYDLSIWNAVKRKTIQTEKIGKLKLELDAKEKGSYGCTPCKEDQTQISLSNNLTVTVCKKIAKKVRTALNKALEQGAKIETITGYRVSKSRGPVDKQGNRTLFSNHAYGVAVDINEKHNGLYANCSKFSPKCRLIKGGKYQPENPSALTHENPIVKEMKKAGFHWGGQIEGDLKDFMHFSPDGY